MNLATRQILALPSEQRSAAIKAMGDYFCELGRAIREEMWAERVLARCLLPWWKVVQ